MDPELLEQAAQRWDSLVQNGIHGDDATRQVDAWIEEQQPGGFEAFGRGAVQGATMEFGDELYGVLRGAAAMVPGGRTPGETYETSRDEARAANLAAREAHPVAYGVGGVTGAAGTALVGGAAAGLVGRGAAKLTLPRVAALGAAEGGVTGAGASEGDLRDRARGAGTGAVIGGIAAPLMVGGARLAGRGVTRGLDVSGIRPTGEGTGVTQAVARGLGVRTKPQRVDDALAARLPDAPGVADASEMLEGAAERGRPMTIMDVDPNMAGTARAARGVQGPAKIEIPDFLQNRVAGQEERILADALDLTGVGERTNVFEHIDEIVTRRSQGAEEAYGAINDIVVDNPELGGYLRRPAFKKAYERVRRDVSNAGGEALPPLSEIIDDDGNMLQGLTVRTLNRVKMGLDSVLEVGRRGTGAEGIAASEQRTIREAKNEFLKILDDSVEGYAGARSAFAGESAMRDAFEDGGELFRKNIHPDQAERALAKMGDSERESYVRGALEGLAAKIEGTAASRDLAKVRPLADITLDKRRLRLLFPDDESFGRFQAGIADELRIAQTRNMVTGGSNTAEKLMEMAEFAGLDIAQFVTNPAGGLLRAGVNAVRGIGQGYSSELAEGMVAPLTATGSEAVSTFNRLTGVRAANAASGARRTVAAAGGVAGAVGPLGSRDENARRRRLAGRR